MEGQTDGQKKRVVERRKSRDHSQWLYRGEGNHNIVIAHKQEKTVYRLAKRQSTATGIPLPGNGRMHVVSGELVRQTLQRRVEFVRHVLGPLLGPHFVHSGELVDLSPLFISDVCENVISPATRDLPADQDFTSGVTEPLVFPFAWCLPDSCFHGNDHNNNQAPTFAVEIKPNVMFMSRSPVEPTSTGSGGDRMSGPSLAALRENVCRHCFTNMCKVKKGKWKRFSTSCPMDLISGDPARMKFALTELFKIPHHRLRVYRDGKTVFKYEMYDDLESNLKSHFGYRSQDNSQVSCLEHFIEVIIQALLLVPDHSTITESTTSNSTNNITNNASSSSSTTDVPNDDVESRRKSNPTLPPSILSHGQAMASYLHGTNRSSLSDIELRETNCDVAACQMCLNVKSTGDFQQGSDLSHSERIFSRPSNGYCSERQGDSRGSEMEHLGQTFCDSCLSSKSLKVFHSNSALMSGMCQASLYGQAGKPASSTHGVPQGCVLDSLRRAQMFSGLTVASAQPYFTKVMEHFNQHPKQRKDACMDGPYDTDVWSNVLKGDLDLLTSPDPDSVEHAIKKVQQFLTFLTLKSASIMITLQPLEKRNSELEKSNCESQSELPADGNSSQTIADRHGNQFKVSICVLDLDPKPLEKIGKIYARDQKDFELYMQCMTEDEVWR